MSELEIKAIKSDSQQLNVKPSWQREQRQGETASLRSLRVEAEIDAISKTLEYTGWNRRRAAQLLSISYRGILYKIRQHNLSPRPRGSRAAARGGDSQGRITRLRDRATGEPRDRDLRSHKIRPDNLARAGKLEDFAMTKKSFVSPMRLFVVLRLAVSFASGQNDRGAEHAAPREVAKSTTSTPGFSDRSPRYRLMPGDTFDSISI